ncbi:DUF3054 domain-containing protein [Nesterenkonia alba]|uniref:DUF3054 domain-containing protein n=1 Tax=Nesterenkonia alba TaxID=515814 RepID=UPI0003B4DEDF|nr:DUF3054 domain-containing protein [Nesterenkonia alba]
MADSSGDREVEIFRSPMDYSVGVTASIFGLDAVLVVIFAALGNRSHQTGLAPVDIVSTAWPFLVGLVAAWWLSFTWKHPLNLWPCGVFTVLVTVAVGMMLRYFLTDGGVQLSFIGVATGTLLVFLLGSRLLLLGLVRARRRSRVTP